VPDQSSGEPRAESGWRRTPVGVATWNNKKEDPACGS
jgi:hypothetical protein